MIQLASFTRELPRVDYVDRAWHMDMVGFVYKGNTYRCMGQGAGMDDGHMFVYSRVGSDSRKISVLEDYYEVEAQDKLGAQDLYAILFDASEAFGPGAYLTCIVPENDIQDIISEFEGYGCSISTDPFLVFTNQGEYQNYLFGGDPTPPTPTSNPDTYFADRRDRFENGAVDGIWNATRDQDIQGDCTLQKQIKQL